MSGARGQGQHWTGSWHQPYGADEQSSRPVPSHGLSSSSPLNESPEDQNNAWYTPRYLPGYYVESEPPGPQSPGATAYDYGTPADQGPLSNPSLPVQHDTQRPISTSSTALPNPAPLAYGAVHNHPTSPNELSTQFGQFGISTPTHHPSQQFRVIRPRQTSQGKIPFTYTTGASTEPNPQGVNEYERKLYASFKRSAKPRKFFSFGKVFLTLWAEPAGESTSSVGSTYTANTSGFSRGSYGEHVFSKIRRFIVVREGDQSCIALPINTYEGKGVSTKGDRKCEHAIIFTGNKPPLPQPTEAPTRTERGLLPQAIRVDGDDPTQKLDPMSRINFGKMYTIEHNVKVKSMGKVNRASESALRYQLKIVWENLLGLSMAGGSDETKTDTGTIESQSSHSIFDWADAYNTLIAAGFTDAKARSVLKPNLPSIPEQPNKMAAEDNLLRTTSKSKKPIKRMARTQIADEQPEIKGLDGSTNPPSN